LVLVPLDESADQELRDELRSTPSDRVKRMLEQLAEQRAGKGR
jgi:hypothetical protein